MFTMDFYAAGYYKPDPEAEYTEDSPGGNFDFLSRLAADWEEAAQLPPECKDVRVVIIRSGNCLMMLENNFPIR